MKSVFLGLSLSILLTSPCFAALTVGDTAPDFRVTASLGGKDFTFHFYEALKQGPVVLYFYPSAYTQGCDLEAHTFAENKDKFAAAGAQIIGVSGDSLEDLNRFASDPDFCASKFPIAADENLKIANSYRLTAVRSLAGIKDIHGQDVEHGLIERMTFVVSENHKVVAVLSSRLDTTQTINQLIEKKSAEPNGPDQALTPDQHVFKSLDIVRHLVGKASQTDRGHLNLKR